MKYAALLLALLACSKKQPPPTEDDYCDGELTEIAGALETELASPGGFGQKTERFTRATMCGPDMAQIVRDTTSSRPVGMTPDAAPCS